MFWGKGNCPPRGVAVAKGCPESCPAHLLREGVDRVLTSAQHVLHCVRALPASHSPSPRQACRAAASSSFPRRSRPSKRFGIIIFISGSRPSLTVTLSTGGLSSYLPQPTSSFLSNFFLLVSFSTLSVGVIFIMSSDRQNKQRGKPMPGSGPRYVFDQPFPPSFPPQWRISIDLNANRFPSRPAWNGSRASPTFSPALNPSRLPNGPPPPQQPKDTGPFPPLNQQNGARPQETDRNLQALTGLIVRPPTILVVIIL